MLICYLKVAGKSSNMIPIGSRLIRSKTLLSRTAMADINKKVGANIRKLRKTKGWSQEKLALEANLHRAYIGQIERGEKNIGLKNLEKIAKTLGIKLKDIMSE